MLAEYRAAEASGRGRGGTGDGAVAVLAGGARLLMGAVLITGGTGFLGLAVAEALLARGEEEVLLAPLPLPQAAARAFATLPGRLHRVPGDVRQPDTLHAAFAAATVDRLLPFAAITPGRSEKRPIRKGWWR